MHCLHEEVIVFIQTARGNHQQGKNDFRLLMGSHDIRKLVENQLMRGKLHSLPSTVIPVFSFSAQPAFALRCCTTTPLAVAALSYLFSFLAIATALKTYVPLHSPF